MFAGAREEQPSDEEARQHEEDVDADKTAPQEPHTGVPKRDKENGYGAKALDVVPMPERCTVSPPLPLGSFSRRPTDGEAEEAGRACGWRPRVQGFDPLGRTVHRAGPKA